MSNNNIKKENLKEKKYTHLNYDDRVIIYHELNKAKIKDLTKFTGNAHISKRKYFRACLKNIANILGKSIKTIEREIKRGTIEQQDCMCNIIKIYYHQTSQNRYIKNITTKEIPLKIDNNIKLAKEIAKLLNKKYSPFAIISLLKKEYTINFSIQTLYNYIDKGLFEGFGYKKINNTIIYKVKGNNTHKKRVIRSGGLSIDDRDEIINNREELGHWEIDSVVGCREGSSKVIMTLTERISRMNIVCLLNSKTNDNVIKEVKRIIKNKKYVIKSITSDNGSEFSNVTEISKLGVKWFYAHPYCSGERGSNENNNKMIRRFIPKGESMDHLTKKDVKDIETFMNNYPRKIFNSSTSYKVYDCLLNLA